MLKHCFLRVVFLLSILTIAPVSPVARAAEGDLSFSVSPESAFSLLDETIRSAKKSIELNIYMLTNRSVMEALVERASAGVSITVLLEGEPFGGEILLPVKNALDDFHKALKDKKGKNSFLVMTSNGKVSKRRFVFNHAKYMLVDGKTALVSSENITGSAFSGRNFSGGARGWQIVVENKKVAGALANLFADDSSARFGDVLPYEQVNFKVKDPGNNPLPPREPRTVNLFPVLRGRAEKAELCLSPNSLDCILSFIRMAKTELLVQHMNLPLYWVNREGGAHKPNPIVHELLAAAKRGVKVKVLLNDDDAFGEKTTGMKEERNDLTVAWLKAEAAKARVSLEALTFNHKAMQVNYVHNKGMVSDSGRVFVSSINGTENSVKNNREVAVAVDSVEAAKYFGEVFAQDWSVSK
jgi:cardiolipin synthase A/B